MSNLIITDENNKQFKIVEQNGKLTIYRIENDVPINASPSEIAYVLNELKKLQNSQILNPEKKSYDEILAMLKEMIRTGTIKDSLDLKKFIDQCDLSEEEKNNLSQEGLTSLNIAEVVDLKNQIINTIRNNKKESLEALVAFTVKDDAIGAKYCEIRLGFKDGNYLTEPIHQNMPYSSVLKQELIEPVLLEVALRSKIKGSFVKKTPDTVNDRGDFGISTEEKIGLSVCNVEYDYAVKLNEQMENLKGKVVENAEDRDAAIDESREQANAKNDQLQNQNYRYDEYGNVFDENGQYVGRIENGQIVREENELDKEKPMVLVKKKKEEKPYPNGFSLSIIVFAITSLITSLLLLFQAFCFFG